MATDRTIIPAQGVGGDTNVPVATRDDASALKHQKVLAEYLVGTTPTEVDASHPLPVVQTGTPGLPTGAATETTLAAASAKLPAALAAHGGLVVEGVASGVAVPVSAAALPLPAGAATETTLAAVNTKLGSALPLPTGAATETTLAAVNTKLGSALPLPTGASTETTLAAASAKLPSTLGQKAMAASMAVVLASDQSAIPVTGGGVPTDPAASGSLTGTTQKVTIIGLNAMATCSIDVSGTFSATMTVEARIDGVNWFSVNIGTDPTSQLGNMFSVATFTSPQKLVLPIAGYDGIRVNCTGYVSGTAVIAMRATAAPDIVRIGAGLPTGSNRIGSIGLNDGVNAASITGSNALKVDGSAVTQPVNNAGTFAVQSTEKPATSGGLTPHSLVSASGNNATSVKGSAGQVYVIEVTNANASPRYFKLYNAATAPTPGSGTPVWRSMIPAGGGFNVSFGDVGLALGTGIAYDLTTGAADADTGSVAASEILVNIAYA